MDTQATAAALGTPGNGPLCQASSRSRQDTFPGVETSIRERLSMHWHHQQQHGPLPSATIRMESAATCPTQQLTRRRDAITGARVAAAIPGQPTAIERSVAMWIKPRWAAVIEPEETAAQVAARWQEPTDG
ncbi:hypothetical protein FN846DRAFT_902407 [Sphaerosporella brunnea]|uniref:Uncharacterized protein n=1 Tax=Sphaerosporella brunnea TaxID=1250544 RepID=A0A5J5FAW1_9PEZI|nr:hypothetical protein FN846DRAFT_902407 [Sphaerosporella brunnea]